MRQDPTIALLNGFMGCGILDKKLTEKKIELRKKEKTI